MAPRKRKAGTVPPQSNFSRIPGFNNLTLDIDGVGGRCSVSRRVAQPKGQDHERDDFILRGPAVAPGDAGFIDIRPSVLRAEALLHTDLVEPGDTQADRIAELEAENAALSSQLDAALNDFNAVLDRLR